MATSQPRLIVGLGNPGRQYEATRHNVGFMVVDRLLDRKAPGQPPRHVADSYVWSAPAAGRQILLQKPLTFMNLSGLAVAAAARQAGIEPAEILVIYDDVDLGLGQLRLRARGSSGGHRGIESILAELQSGAFMRLRVGIGRHQDGDTIDHVLSPFEPEEQPIVSRVIDAAAEAAMLCVHRGLTAAMNAYNGATFDEPTDNAKRGEPEG